MKKTSKLEKYSKTTHPISGICKRSALWGHKGSRIFPLIYFQKPKWISEESFTKIIESIELNLDKNTKIKGDK